MTSVFFLYLPKNLDLLKAELKEYRGDIRPSFMTPGFATFIIDNIALQSLKQNKPKLCLAMGFDAKRVEHEASVWCENQELFFSGDEEFYFRDPKGQVWHGDSRLFAKMAQLSTIKLPPYSPSRAWLKIAQAFALYPRERSGHALEIGSSPGGASLFLLEQGFDLIGIDPGEMHPDLMNMPKFKHLKKSIQDITKSDLGQTFDVLAVDTNLPPLVSMNESLRVAAFSGEQLKEMFLTIKLPSPRLVRGLSKYANQLRKMGFKSRFIQLPSHHSEILLYATRSFR